MKFAFASILSTLYVVSVAAVDGLDDSGRELIGHEVPTPAPTLNTGACCIVKNGHEKCVEVVSGVCTNSVLNGRFVGLGTKCSTEDICQLAPTPAPTLNTGACCIVKNGHEKCVEVVRGACTNSVLNGRFIGLGTKCSTEDICQLAPTPAPTLNTGACCIVKKGHEKCVEVVRGVCTNSVLNGRFIGLGTKCSTEDICQLAPTPAPTLNTGACFIVKNGAPFCVEVREGVCTNVELRGKFKGLGTKCPPTVSPPTPPPVATTTPGATGACCFASKGLCKVLKRNKCLRLGGWFEGEGTKCTPKTCPAAYGACCLKDNSCIVTKPKFCAFKKGDFAGFNTVCTRNTCPLAGACCLKNGKCRIFPESKCWKKGGTFKGGPCKKNLCPYY